MKKFLLLTMLFISIFTTGSYAKIIRMGYTGPQIAGTDYTNLQIAHDAAAIGDTLLFFPGSYAMNRATKRLIYIAYGYYTTGAGSNPNLQLLSGICTVDLYLDATASGSVFEGIENLVVGSYFLENVNDVIIRRCNVNLGVYNHIGSTCNNWQISQCNNVSFSGDWSGGNATNFRVDNSRVTRLSFGGNTAHTGQFNNCLFINFGLNLNNNAINFQNCIFYGVNFNNFTSSIFQNNLFSLANPGLTGSNNQYNFAFTNAGVNTVFTGFPTVVAGETTDGQYKLKAGSPAIAAGIGGIDLGMFGGPNPYRLSGIPAIPAFYKLTAPSNNATTNPYTLTFSVRSNN